VYDPVENRLGSTNLEASAWVNVFEDGPRSNPNEVVDRTPKSEVFGNLDAKLIATNF
jgi:hypothetical protein